MFVNGGGKGEIPRKVDVDPYFDNTKLVFGEAGTKVPYTPQNTWKDPNGDRKDYLDRTKGLTTMQKVSCGSELAEATRICRVPCGPTPDSGTDLFNPSFVTTARGVFRWRLRWCHLAYRYILCVPLAWLWLLAFRNGCSHHPWPLFVSDAAAQR